MHALCTSLLVIATTLGAPSTDLREQAREILEDDAYQTELPEAAAAPDLPDLDFELPGWLRSIAFVATGIALALLLLWLIREWRRYTRDASVESEEESVEVAERKRRRAEGVETARGLAGQGRYAEAVHTLLLLAVVELAERAGWEPPESLTSREILARAPVPTTARGALGELVSVVEISHFGRRPVSAGDYRRCEGFYEAFVEHCEASR